MNSEQEYFRRLELIVQNTTNMIVVTDRQRRIEWVNPAFTRVTGWSLDLALGREPGELLHGPETDPEVSRRVDAQLAAGQAVQNVELLNYTRAGQAYWVNLNIQPIRDGQGQVSQFISIQTDITDRKRTEREIQRLAYFDPLTGLPNRRLLLDQLTQVVASAAHTGECAALFFIDLDNFKDLNDTLGHGQGDQLLQSVAQQLQANTRQGLDFVARLGGDEFVVVTTRLHAELSQAAVQAHAVGEKLLVALNQSVLVDDQQFCSTPSIGVTVFGAQAPALDELLKQADLAMYEAKASGKNAVRFFEERMQIEVMDRARMETDLRHGLARDELFLQYQPIVGPDGAVRGVEALVRWLHPRRGLISPARFIPLAEQSGLIVPLGQWVLQQACHQLVQWAHSPGFEPLSIAVNVSARQIRHPQFVEHVRTVLLATGANPRRLKLELTESLMLHDVEDIISKMSALKAEGVMFALDDFGTGYSSLSYLKRLPLDQIKIDQSFVRDVLTDPNDAAIARTIVTLAQCLNLDVVAEGVETEAQRHCLIALGCTTFQGYLFSRPDAAVAVRLRYDGA